MGRKLGTEVGVNSSFVALIATESVSIAIPWLLLRPEVGVNRHGHLFKINHQADNFHIQDLSHLDYKNCQVLSWQWLLTLKPHPLHKVYMITVVLGRSASHYVPSRETPLQERSHKMPLRQRHNTKVQTSY